MFDFTHDIIFRILRLAISVASLYDDNNDLLENNVLRLRLLRPLSEGVASAGKALPTEDRVMDPLRLSLRSWLIQSTKHASGESTSIQRLLLSIDHEMFLEEDTLALVLSGLGLQSEALLGDLLNLFGKLRRLPALLRLLLDIPTAQELLFNPSIQDSLRVCFEGLPSGQWVEIWEVVATTVRSCSVLTPLVSSSLALQTPLPHAAVERGHALLRKVGNPVIIIRFY